MCGIVGAVAARDVVPILVEGLRRLEYRGYDSAGLVVVSDRQTLDRVRRKGKVEELSLGVRESNTHGYLGIAHTRWATHGRPSEENAHPHICRKKVAVVHNGIIENHEALRYQQTAAGYEFTSQTDTEVIVHQVFHYLERGQDLLAAVQSTVRDLVGAYAIGVIHKTEPGRLVVARRGSPLIVGIGIGENFIASDVAALLPVTNRFIFLEDGDVVDIAREKVAIYDADGRSVTRPIKTSTLTADAAERGEYRHYMLKEIFEQTRAVADTVEGRINTERLLEESFGSAATKVLKDVEGVHIIACGTSYHAGMIGRYWLEAVAGIPCNVEIASEFRYRQPVVRKNHLVLTLSQSGETADTLAGLQEAKRLGYGHSLSICNVPESSLVRESDLCLMTRAGPEIGVASTKAFTTQLVALQLLTLALGRGRGLSAKEEQRIVGLLRHLPAQITQVLEQTHAPVKALAERFIDKQHALFLGRGPMYPVAMEGALKLKEISYIHAEAYPAGELKHGPLALVDEAMPVIIVAPNNQLLEKLKSNMQEVQARGGKLLVFADAAAGVKSSPGIEVITMPHADDLMAPILYTIPLQLLAYYVAVNKGTDVDQPRNLAKSVTVE
ncbi:MAG: glutamine--fructose-6-phosphate transaminase (isomerizing) [Pseudomonadota bacterium]